MPAKARKRLRNIPGAVGVDEAGRGPLAGPVCAAAVLLPPDFRLGGINDSKLLAPEVREELAWQIKERAYWSVAFAEVEEIDRLNILWATMEAMRRAVLGLDQQVDKVFIDGNHVPPDFEFEYETVIKGDGKLKCIAAASILAKTERDKRLKELSETYPAYGFDKHFGYATPEHLEALRKHGPCPEHRKSFCSVQEAYQLCLTFENEDESLKTELPIS